MQRDCGTRTPVLNHDTLGRTSAARGVHNHGSVCGLRGSGRDGVLLALLLELVQWNGLQGGTDGGRLGLLIAEYHSPSEQYWSDKELITRART